MSSTDPGSLAVSVPSRKAFWVLLALVIFASGYAIFLHLRVGQLQSQLVQEASSSASPLALCQTGRDRDGAELNRLRKDLTEVRDARIASEQKESACLIQLGLAQQRAAAASSAAAAPTTTNP